MDSGKNVSKHFAARNHKIYMDLKFIIREHALQFLPAKSLSKFQGVCRDWKLLIASPFFAHKQSLSFSSFSGMFFQSPGDAPAFISLDPESCGVPDPALSFLPVPVDILSSSNGLLCCRAQTSDRAYYICNPVTKQWKKLPQPSMEHGAEPAAVLIFKPSLLNFVAEYKLICAFSSIDFDDATEFEIYSSKDNSWKVSGEISFATKKVIPKSGVCVNDVVYWQSSYSILVYDTTKDRSQVIHGSYNGSYGTLGEYNGKLCSASLNGGLLSVSVISNIYSNTMQMNSRARLWDDKIRINLSAQNCSSYNAVRVLCAGSEHVLYFSGRNVYKCDLKTKQTKLLAEAPRADVKVVLPYVNSLVAI